MCNYFLIKGRYFPLSKWVSRVFEWWKGDLEVSLKPGLLMKLPGWKKQKLGFARLPG
jgi:hypothetical protein